ncbi:NAD(P)-dependent dehydrogenase (short-subunit alcohol dehydrogenase family) [Nocardioides sp. J9]|uniref:SDR family NAD(P)-dependent oxidoreductase n=1 Tax=unclassified Nocardioides TaxID=2615069 RepID=UPI0004B89A49|nr:MULTISPECIES: glucose 1-dehydrogenase [unclassified Nocardioides]TWG96344.1 NAD(P)-dependent dehydrogenase (short-subunit alcohol dehydrogenase family) [Nocardioides sp. J9]
MSAVHVKPVVDRFAGRVAVVTGGASGIGAATIRRFHAEGASVVIADVQEVAGKELATELGERAIFVRTDVSVEEDVAALVDAAVQEFGRIDVFYANAGVMGALGPIAKLRTEDVDATIAINLRGVLLSFKHATRVMTEQGSGVLLATSSPAGLQGGPGPHVYSATKAGIIGLTQSVAAEVRPLGIRANVIVPGAMLTAMNADILTGDANDLDGAEKLLADWNLIDRPGLPEDIAGAAAFLASDDGRFITGVTLNVDAGMCTAPGPSAFAGGQWENPVGMFEAGRRS